jgi:energy-coupling factor transporter ATP-binding protein EcfA2
VQNIASTNVKPPDSVQKEQLTIALAGNPNAGKTTLFNALTGLRQKVANYPGVTVERKEGEWKLGDNCEAYRFAGAIQSGRNFIGRANRARCFNRKSKKSVYPKCNYCCGGCNKSRKKFVSCHTVD